MLRGFIFPKFSETSVMSENLRIEAIEAMMKDQLALVCGFSAVYVGFCIRFT